MSTDDVSFDNFDFLVDTIGSISKISKVSGVPYSTLVNIKHRRSSLNSEHCGQIEEALGLASGWLNTPHGPEHKDKLLGLERIEALARDENSAELQVLRRENMRRLVGPARGSQSALCAMLSWVPAEYTNLSKRTFGSRKARKIEASLELPSGWLDTERPEDPTFPEDLNSRIAAFRRGALPAADTPYKQAQFEKTAATLSTFTKKCGPIARALIETLSLRANHGELSEEDALVLLNLSRAKSS